MDEQTKQASENEYKLRRPVEFEGQTYEALNLDFERLTGADIINCERQFAYLGGGAGLLKDTNKTYQAIVAATAAGVPFDLMKQLSAKDFTRITVMTQNFLIGQG